MRSLSWQRTAELLWTKMVLEQEQRQRCHALLEFDWSCLCSQPAHCSPVSPHALNQGKISPQTLQSITSLSKWFWKIHKSSFNKVKRISESQRWLLTWRTVSQFLKVYSNLYSLFCNLEFNKVFVNFLRFLQGNFTQSIRHWTR